jgi:magnesium-transporting ATPase (P-type)
MKEMIFQRDIRVLAGAAISSLGIYCPIPILRGAIFGLFPGIANRSWRMAIKGSFFGALFDASYVVLWVVSLSNMLNLAWDPRHGYNKYLADWLPGSTWVQTHCNSPWSNVEQFHFNVMLWLTLMVFGWWLVWRPRLSIIRLLAILVTANVTGFVACTILWGVSPIDDLWAYFRPAPSGDLHGVPWLVVFLAVFPICGILTAQWFKKGNAELSPAGDRLKAPPEE